MTLRFFLTFFLALFVTLAACAHAAEAPVDVTFYYSKKDPHLPGAEKALADAVRQLPQLRINRVSIDDPEGYKLFTADEKSHEIKEPGEMMIIFGPYAVTSKGERRTIEQTFAGTMTRLIDQMKGKNDFKQRLTVDIFKYATEVFGKDAKAAAVRAGVNTTHVYYQVMLAGKPVGWVVDAYQVIPCPICSDTQFLLAADTKGNIIEVRPARELERYGAKLPDEETRKFAGQFKSKSPASLPLKIDAISGATKTTHAYQAALTEILEELKKH